MRKRGRSRTKFTWFPTAWTEGEDASQRIAGIDFALAVNRNGSITTGIIPLTADAPKEPADNDPRTTTGILADIVGQEYFLRRVVGKFHIVHEGALQINGEIPTQNTFNQFPVAALVGAGLFVARADDISAGGVDLPVGATVGATLREQYSPLHVNTIREPWIWRRTWVLTQAYAQFVLDRAPSFTAADLNGKPFGFPTTTADYGSVADGPTIDAKTARRITNDDRLWLAVSTQIFPVNTDSIEDGAIRGHFDYRLLAGLRKARNTGSF